MPKDENFRANFLPLIPTGRICSRAAEDYQWEDKKKWTEEERMEKNLNPFHNHSTYKTKIVETTRLCRGDKNVTVWL